MSTNNNRLGKETKPVFVDEQAQTVVIKKLSGAKLQKLIQNKLSDCDAVTLVNRGITIIEDLEGLTNLRRLDLSNNQIGRLSGFERLAHLSMLNVSSNELKGDASLEELRYLPELRTLNIGNNLEIKSIRSHVVKPLSKLQAFVAHSCGLERVSFLRHLTGANSIILSKNMISQIKMSEFGLFANLTKFSIGHNLLQSVPDLSTCPNLTELRINNNLIAELPESILALKKLKTLDVSQNKLTRWADVKMLSGLRSLTNLSLKGNLLPPPTEAELTNISIREDLAGEKLDSGEEKRFRRMVLSFFQHLVGAQGKPHVQLIVLDNRRVKLKWSHNKSSNRNSHTDSTQDASTNPSPNFHEVTIDSGTSNKKRKLKEEMETVEDNLEFQAEQNSVSLVKKKSKKGKSASFRDAPSKALDVEEPSHLLDDDVLELDDVVQSYQATIKERSHLPTANPDAATASHTGAVKVTVFKPHDQPSRNGQKKDKKKQKVDKQGATSVDPFALFGSADAALGEVGSGSSSSW